MAFVGSFVPSERLLCVSLVLSVCLPRDDTAMNYGFKLKPWCLSWRCVPLTHICSLQYLFIYFFYIIMFTFTTVVQTTVVMLFKGSSSG